MKASELRPGQWFQYLHWRCLCVNVDVDSQIVQFATKKPGWNAKLNSCGLNCNVTPLAVAGWDDEPVGDDKLESILSQMNGNPDSYRECVGNPRKVLARICENATLKSRRKSVPAWSVIGEWTGHGSGVSAAIYEYYSENDAKPVEPAPSTPEPQPFKAGDWVVCVRGHLHPDVDLIEGQLYRITDASGWIYLDAKGQTRGGWHRDRFRHATAAEIAAAQEPKPLQLAEGKYYERRDGEIVGPAERAIGLPWRVGDFYYENDGTWNGDTPSDLATFLIREVQPPGQCQVCSDGTCDGCESGREWQPELVAQVEQKREAEADAPKQYRPFTSLTEIWLWVNDPNTDERWLCKKDRTVYSQVESVGTGATAPYVRLDGRVVWPEELFSEWIDATDGEPCGIEVK